MPIGALAEIREGRLHLQAVVARPDGTKVFASRLRATIRSSWVSYGSGVARKGGDAILEEVYRYGIVVAEEPSITLIIENQIRMSHQIRNNKKGLISRFPPCTSVSSVVEMVCCL